MATMTLHQTSKRITFFWLALLVVGLLATPAAFAAPVPGGSLDPLTIPKYVQPLVIPPVMPPATAQPTVPGVDPATIPLDRRPEPQIQLSGLHYGTNLGCGDESTLD